MFRFAKRKEIICMIIGSFCSILIGGSVPWFAYFWGNMTDSFSDSNEMVNQSFNIFIQYLILGGASVFAGWGMQYLWNMAGENQANECRKSFVQSLMRQEVGWFETQNSSEIISTFLTDSLSFQMAIGEKVSLIIYLLSMLISGITISIMQGWEMALVMLATITPLVISWGISEKFNTRKS